MVQLLEWLPSMHEVLGLSPPAPHKLGTVIHNYTLSTQEIKAGISEIQRYHLLHRELRPAYTA